MAIQKIMKLTTDGYEEFTPIQQSTGVADAGKVAVLSATGQWDASTMPDGVGADIQVAPAYENLSAGDWVNLFLDTGNVLKVRKADAALGFAKPAIGYVKDTVTIGENASVYTSGFNTQVTGLTVGSYYYLSNTIPGKMMTTIPGEATNHIRQRLGYAVSPTSLLVKITEPIKRG